MSRNFMFRDLLAAHQPAEVENYQITVATAGTELPIVSIGYATGTITLTDGSASVTGSGTSFVGNVSVSDKIETAGGNVYIVMSIESDTALTLLEPASADESGVTYKAYEVNRTVRVKLKADPSNTDNVYVGQIGVTDSTGFELDAGKEIDLILNNGDANLYVDADANGQILHVIVEKGGTMQAFVPSNVTNAQRTKTVGAGSMQLIATKVNTVAVHIACLVGNTNPVFIGDSSVSNTNGFELQPGDNVTLFLNDNNADLYFYASLNEGVAYIATY